jgi:hypothetical protein
MHCFINVVSGDENPGFVYLRRQSGLWRWKRPGVAGGDRQKPGTLHLAPGTLLGLLWPENALSSTP